MSNKAQHHKSDRAGESEVDWIGESGRTSESALSRSDWVCWNVRLESYYWNDFLSFNDALERRFLCGELQFGSSNLF